MQFINRSTHPHNAIYTLLLFFLLTPFLYAATMDGQLPMRLFAQKADLNQQTHTGEYTGDVKLHQGDHHLSAARVITKTNSKNKMIEAFAYGNEQKPVHFWTKTDPEKPFIHAYANEIRYFPEQHLIELIGHARIYQAKNAFLAPYIRYDIQREHVLSQAKGKTRIHILFYPEQTNPSNKITTVSNGKKT